MSLPPFQALLDAHRVDVYRFLVVTAGRADADDLFQETWIAALRAYPRVRRTDNLRAWLFRIAQNKTIDAARARGRQPVPVGVVPDRATTSNEHSEIWAPVRALPPKQRTAVFCRVAMDMPYAELAELLGSTEEAARRNVHEGLKRLREEMDDE